MYESFYGLKEKPFNLTPDPDYLYMSPTHENAFTHLEYALAENKGFAVISGEVGAGKTTLINYLLSRIQQDTVVGLLNNTSVPTQQFMRLICEEFELQVKGMNKADMLDRLRNFLLSCFAESKRVVLIIDEAQNLPAGTLEEIRMLSNLEAEKHHLIQIILCGQPELRTKLKRQELRQFAQRVTVHCHLGGLDSEQVTRYIRHRLHIAGADHHSLFTEDALKAVFTYSKGIPRIINILCDAALVYGFADGLKIIDGKVIEEVVRDKRKAGLFEPQVKKRPAQPGKEKLSPTIGILKRLEALDKSLARLMSLIEQYSDEQSQRDEAFRAQVLHYMDKLVNQEKGKEKGTSPQNQNIQNDAKSVAGTSEPGSIEKPPKPRGWFLGLKKGRGVK